MQQLWTYLVAFLALAPAAAGAPPSKRGPAAESLVRAVKNGTGFDLVPVALAGDTVSLGGPALAGIQFLPIDFTGHAAAAEFDAASPRVEPLSSGVVALALPDAGRTLLIHFRRATSPSFGFAAVFADGTVRVLVEHVGIGPGNAIDPFDFRVAVAPRGSRVLFCAPGFSHGLGGLGKIWLARIGGAPLAGGADVVDLAPGGGTDLDPESPTFFDGGILAAGNDLLLRAPDDGSGPFLPVAIPPSGGVAQPAVIGQFAVSADRSTLVFLAGKDEDNVDLYVVKSGAAPINRTQAPGKLDPPGYLPGTTDGPLLTLSEDGAIASFLQEFAGGKELYMIGTAPGSGPPVQVTTDANFEHSIDAMSGMHGGGAKLSFLAGGGAAGADLYSAELLPGGTLALQNVTATSGVTAPTFANAATLDVASTRTHGVRRLIVDDRTTAGQGFALLDVANGATASVAFTGLSAPPSITAATRAGGGLALIAESAAGGATLAWGVPGAALEAVIVVPAGVALDSLAVDANGSIGALRASLGAGVEFPVVVRFGTGAATIAGAVPESGVRDLGFSRFSRLLWTASDGAGRVRTLASAPPYSTAIVVGGSAADAFWLR